MILSVDKAKMEPKLVKVLYKEGNEVTYMLKKFSPNVDAESVFTFDKASSPV
ncbi:MAG: hypothetical protein IPO87_15735 [Flavobacteriales bacterium]|nr:hypothetical protein [Flavobacteriales bacterium]